MYYDMHELYDNYSLTKLAVCCPADPEKGNCKFTHYWKLNIEDDNICIYVY